MALPLYEGSDVARKNNGHSNAGLWFERFFHRYDRNWEVPKPNDKGSAKLEWINEVTGFQGDNTALKNFAERQKELGSSLNASAAVFKPDWHFVTGLGLSHPVENGFAWHPTLGTPYLPGSSVKGLLRAWVEVWASDEEIEPLANSKLELLKRWFGSENGETPETFQAGELIFFDAIPIGEVTLAADVVTPHMGQWYEAGGEIKDVTKEPEKVPADWHSPVPSPFLVVQQAKFLFQIAPRTENHAVDAETAMAWLGNALDYLGAGAKTAAGYGRMLWDEKENSKISKERQEAKLSAMPREDALREKVKLLSIEEVIKLFGKEKNKTRADYGANFDLFARLVKEHFTSDIEAWKSETKKTGQNKFKAYKFFSGEGDGE